MRAACARRRSCAVLVPPLGGSSSTLTTHSPVAQRARELRLALRLRRRGGEQLGLAGLERRTRGRRCSSSAPRIDSICAGVVPQQPPMMRAPSALAWAANSAKYSGVECGIDDAAADDAGEADVRQGRERQLRVAASRRARSARRAGRRRGCCRSRPRRAAPAARRPRRRRCRREVSASSSKVSSATIGSEETPRTRLDGDLERVEVEERLEHEEVDTAAFEDLRLLGVERPVLGSTSSISSSPSGPIAPAMKTSRPETSRASRASRTAAELMRSKSSPSRCRARLRRLAPNVFVSISSAPARM